MKLDQTIRRLALACFLAAVAGANAAASAASMATAPAEEGAKRPALEAPSSPPLEAPVPVAEISARSEALISTVRRMAPGIEARARLDEIEAELKRLGGYVWTGIDDTRAVLEQGPRLDVVDDLESEWSEGRKVLLAQNAALTARAQEADAALEEVKRARERWNRTEVAARENDAPEPVIARIGEVEAEIDAARTQLLALRARILALQDTAARQLAVCDEVLAGLARHRSSVVNQIGSPNMRPLWRANLGERDRSVVAGRFAHETLQEFRRSNQFLERRTGIFQLQLLALVVLLLLFRAAHRRAEQWVERDPALQETVGALERPYSAAIVLTVVSSLWLHPGLPRVLVHVVTLLAFLPVLRILRHLVHPGLVWLLYTFAGFFFVDRVRDIVAPAPLLEQLVLSVEMGVGLVILAVVLRPGRLEGLSFSPLETRWLRGLSWLARGLAIAFGAVFIAAVSGYMQLARIIASATLGSIYVAMGIYAAARAMGGLVAFLLRVPPLATMRTVQRHRGLLEQRLELGIRWIATAAWAYAAARNLAFFGLSSEALSQVLGFDVALGSITLSLGDLLAFGLTIWGAFLLSRFVRFLLGEEIYPRLQLAHGAPYAISSLANYAILLGGFLLAMSGLGLDLNRFTVLTGAFGVGIGFGLQTIVNNFVSGLILLFERPIQIGDTVQVGDMTGDVKRIGIRSSTLRTGSGAELIVPNSMLMSERVINWTLSDTSRRIDLPVGVAYGAEPERVLELLKEVARKHADVLQYPEPVALFVRFGESAIDFELRAWVQDGTRWQLIKTELAVALFRSLKDAGIEIPFPQREVRVVENRG